MKEKKAFTLIELLVVIAIIALLLSILLPALKKVKKLGQIAVCTSNCKNLSTAWATYAAANEEKIVSAMTGYSSYFNHLSKSPLLCPNPWVDWAGYPDPEYKDPVDRENQIKTVEQGVLYPYVKTIKAYRCPSSKKGQIKCYAIPDNMGNLRFEGHSALGDQDIKLKTTDIRTTSEQIIFLDEDVITYGGYTVPYGESAWHDLPPSRHNNGITLGYADGHAGYYKWREKETLELCEKIRENRNSVTDADRVMELGNEDLMMMQRGIYGSIGYSPTP